MSVGPLFADLAYQPPGSVVANPGLAGAPVVANPGLAGAPVVANPAGVPAYRPRRSPPVPCPAPRGHGPRSGRGAAPLPLDVALPAPRTGLWGVRGPARRPGACCGPQAPLWGASRIWGASRVPLRPDPGTGARRHPPTAVGPLPALGENIKRGDRRSGWPAVFPTRCFVAIPAAESTRFVAIPLGAGGLGPGGGVSGGAQGSRWGRIGAGGWSAGGSGAFRAAPV